MEVVIIPYYGPISGNFKGFVFLNPETLAVMPNIVIKRRTHARNYALKMGWEVI